MGSGCCASLGSGMRSFHTFTDGDSDVVDVALSNETQSQDLIFPFHLAWSRHIGCSATWRVCGSDVFIQVREDKNNVRVSYAGNTIPLIKTQATNVRKEDLTIDGQVVPCNVVEYNYSFVSNVMHVWHLWLAIDADASALPLRILHRCHSSTKKDKLTAWLQLQLRDVTPNCEDFPCRSFLETDVDERSGVASQGPSKTLFLSARAPGWVVQGSLRRELSVEAHANTDLSWDVFPVIVFRPEEYHVFLSHLTP